MAKSRSNTSLIVQLPLIISTALAIGILTGVFLFKTKKNESIGNKREMKKINEIINLINKEYVDEVEISKLTESAIEEMLNKLDPHSNYIPLKQREISEMSFESNYEGIGIEFNILKDSLVVISALSGGPSERLGILAGDRIVKIDGEKVAGVGLDNQKVFDLLRGEKGSIVEIEIIRGSSEKPIQYSITRDKVSSISVDAAFMIKPQLGYIKVNRFTDNTASEFRKAVEDLNNKGMRKMILDLRNNSGGVLSSALYIVDELLEDGKLILYTKGKSSQTTFEYDSRIEGQFENGDLIILINEGSASASEIVAGALQDQDRALIMGRRSFGKGLVQSSFDLVDGSELRMTISKYYIPSGRSIQKPFRNGNEAYFRDIVERFEHGEFFHSDSIDFPDSLTFQTASGRKVYGGGGIMPDIFIPIDTNFSSDYLIELNSKNVLYSYSFEYSNKNRTRLEQMSLIEFVDFFEIDSKMLENLVEAAEKEGVTFVADQFEKSELMIKTQIKALIARNIWRDTGFYQIYNSIDPTFQAAVKQIDVSL